MKFGLKLAAVFMSAGLLTAGAAVAPAGAASTATPQCTRQVQMKPVPAYSYYMMIPKSSSTVKCYLKEGSKNSAVVALQTALKFCYGRDIVVDGDYGSRTAAALHWVQMIYLFPEQDELWDGVYGLATANAITFPWHRSNGEIMSTCTRRDGSS
ncbi:peptidoglycan-binding protein [Streptomyces sp. GESEQ-35]|uniref:peptidoglycan-binding domain-containing protein n=1 Tax=Streptomyces sp. GESEQ-35 TaxID=2812657 RepID=UPI001B33A455|nr:peptidoglycan-binding domain-containing protein [Streptomyces sp. GESEQ-35]